MSLHIVRWEEVKLEDEDQCAGNLGGTHLHHCHDFEQLDLSEYRYYKIDVIWYALVRL